MSQLYTRAVIALGSNLGERNDTLSAAVADLVDPPEVRLLAISPIVQTKAVGGPPGQPDFLNMVIAVETTPAPAGTAAALPRRGTETPACPRRPLGPADPGRGHHHLRGRWSAPTRSSRCRTPAPRSGRSCCTRGH